MLVTKSTKRPVYLNIFAFKFPITAIASILHRISGVVAFFFIPLAIWGLQQSLSSATKFDLVRSAFSHYCYKWLIWLGLAALSYHLIAGIRHVIMDCGWGESKTAARASSWLVLIGSGLVIIILAYMLLW